MRSASLKCREFHSPCLAVTFCRQEICQIGSGSLKLLMSESIHIVSYISQLAYITSVCQFYSLGNSNHNGRFFAEQLFYFFQKFVNIKRNFREIDQIRPITVFCLCQRSSSGKPSCVSSHDLHNSDHVFLVSQTLSIPDHLFCRSSNVFCRASKAWCMIGKSQVIVYSFRNSQKFLTLSSNDSVI